MKINMPVTDTEVHMKEGEILVSKTDLKGIITYVNRPFIEISGFSQAELVGKNHNLVRHPDMPPEAFNDLWTTIKAGKPWVGLVKNRCKNGDFYWVQANVTPISQNGQVVEYMSVRSKPSREQIQAAEKLYQGIRNKTESLQGVGLKRLQHLYKKVRYSHQMLALFAIIILSQFFVGYETYVGLENPVAPLQAANKQAQTLTQSTDDALIAFKTQVQEWKNVLIRGNDPEQFRKYLGKFENQERLVQDKLSDIARHLSEINLDSRRIERVRDAHLRLGQSYREALKQYDIQNFQSFRIVDQAVQGIDRETATNIDDLVSWVHQQTDAVGAQRAGELSAKVDNTKGLLSGSLVLSLIALFSAAALMRNGILRPMQTIHQSFRALTEGDFSQQIDISGDTEISDLNRGLKSMQIKVGFDLVDAQTQADESSRIRQALDACNTNVMLADPEMNIIYLNNAVQQMFQDAEADLKEDLPNLNASELLGANVDIFHKHPEHQRKMIAQLEKPYHSRIQVGGHTFDLIATPVFTDTGSRLGTVVEWDDVTKKLRKAEEEQRIANENLRIKQALDNVSANVMVADPDRNIIYMNDSVIQTLRNAQSDLRKELPNFDVDKLQGASIDIFHKKPEYQAKLLASLKDTYNASIVVGGRTMDLSVNPIINEAEERLGTVVEWKDRTTEVAIEKEVDSIVEAASSGDLSRRIDLAGKAGFFEKLSRGLNELLESASGFVADTGNLFSRLAEGDLTKAMNEGYQGDFHTIAQDANTTIQKLTDIISQIRESANTVHTAATEIAQGNADLSQRTEEQASSLEETASSMEQITATVKQSADHSTNANALANEARDKAQKGGQVVQEAVGAMREILTASNRINDIISVIDEIAFQTNLLALNAAVEAARAGEQGRGFAVVAGEVRNLSQRSAAAAREIKDLIRDSVSKVETGSILVNESGETLTAIVHAVEKVARTIAEVNNAAREQTSGIEQINQAVSQMDEMTQQNAALVEQASAASEAMSDQASGMNRLISFFRIGDMSVKEVTSLTNRNLTVAESDIKTYQPAPPSKAVGKQAAAFSEEDEWEDF